MGSLWRNYYIYDGDSARINPVKDINDNELFTTASLSFSPNKIKINVVGEVFKHGAQTIKTNSPLTQAILSTGGITKKSYKNNIALIKLNTYGNISKSIYPFKISQKIDPLKNPALIGGDKIIFEQNAWAKNTECIKN